MSARAMNDEEVTTELNKMVSFIKQEALEKAREVRVKADEEFAIEKAKLVKQETQAIDALYEKKRKGAEVAQKIAQSNLTSKSRLKLLHRREEHLQDLFSTTRTAIAALSDSEERYVQILESVTLEGLLQLIEPVVTVLSRARDAEVVQSAAQNAARAYKEMSGRDVEVSVESSLKNTGSGGVKLVNGTKRIVLDNTLDERLRLLEDKMLPEIRKGLFGANPNRKFLT